MCDTLPSQERLAVYTIGHSNHAPERLRTLLQDNGIAVLADVRSHPGSRWVPYATQKGLQALLHPSGISYLYLGESLGGRPADPECYDPQTGKPNYRVMQQKEVFRQGIARLLTGLRSYCVCLLCAEEDPAHCHRTLLIGDALKREGVALRHIRGDGTVQVDKALENQAAILPAAQLTFPFPPQLP